MKNSVYFGKDCEKGLWQESNLFRVLLYLSRRLKGRRPRLNPAVVQTLVTILWSLKSAKKKGTTCWLKCWVEKKKKEREGWEQICSFNFFLSETSQRNFIMSDLLEVTGIWPLQSLVGNGMGVRQKDKKRQVQHNELINHIMQLPTFLLLLNKFQARNR